MARSIGYKVKHLFMSREQKEVEARMEYRQNLHFFEKQAKDLDRTMAKFTKMAKDAELRGDHAGAVSCATFIQKMQRAKLRVQSMIQRFEMTYSMLQLSQSESRFTNACANMASAMSENIDLNNAWKSTAELDTALGKLDMMTDELDSIFNTIDSALGDSSGETSEQEATADAEELLNNIMGRHNKTAYVPEAEPAVTNMNTEAAPPAEQKADDTDERLRSMMEDLNN